MPAVEIETPLLSIRCSLGPDSFHTATRSRRAEPARNMRSPFLPDTFLVIFQVCATRKASFRVSSPPWFCTVGDLGSPPSWLSCLAPRSLVPLLGHGVALYTTARVSLYMARTAVCKSASPPTSPKTQDKKIVQMECAEPDVHDIHCSASTVKLRFGLRPSSVQHKGGAPVARESFGRPPSVGQAYKWVHRQDFQASHVGQRGGCFETVIDNEAQ